MELLSRADGVPVSADLIDRRRRATHPAYRLGDEDTRYASAARRPPRRLRRWRCSRSGRARPQAVRHPRRSSAGKDRPGRPTRSSWSPTCCCGADIRDVVHEPDSRRFALRKRGRDLHDALIAVEQPDPEPVGRQSPADLEADSPARTGDDRRRVATARHALSPMSGPSHMRPTSTFFLGCMWPIIRLIYWIHV